VRRWGQSRPQVHLWRFVVRGTVDETITAAHQRDLWKGHLGRGRAAVAAGVTSPGPAGGG